MSLLGAPTDFDDAGARRRRVSPIASGFRYDAGRVIFAAILLPAMTSLFVAAAWLFWTLASSALGSQGAVCTMVALVGAAAALSRRTLQGFVGSLIILGSGGCILLLATLFGVAGYGLIFGG